MNSEIDNSRLSCITQECINSSATSIIYPAAIGSSAHAPARNMTKPNPAPAFHLQGTTSLLREHFGCSVSLSNVDSATFVVAESDGHRGRFVRGPHRARQYLFRVVDSI